MINTTRKEGKDFVKWRTHDDASDKTTKMTKNERSRFWITLTIGRMQNCDQASEAKIYGLSQSTRQLSSTQTAQEQSSPTYEGSI